MSAPTRCGARIVERPGHAAVTWCLLILLALLAAIA